MKYFVEKTISKSSVSIEEWGSEKGEKIKVGVKVELEHRMPWLMLGIVDVHLVFHHNFN